MKMPTKASWTLYKKKWRAAAREVKEEGSHKGRWRCFHNSVNVRIIEHFTLSSELTNFMFQRICVRKMMQVQLKEIRIAELFSRKNFHETNHEGWVRLLPYFAVLLLFLAEFTSNCFCLHFLCKTSIEIPSPDHYFLRNLEAQSGWNVSAIALRTLSLEAKKRSTR